jgi:predicted transposase YdaD
LESFDQSLKCLLHHEPEDFIRFGLKDSAAQVVRPIDSDLPARGRVVDGGYLVEHNGALMVIHIEFHRRNQSLEDLALDVLEAQVRIYDGERAPVLTHVWDLNGQREAPVLQKRVLHFGAPREEEHSVCVYHWVNLQALGSEELFSLGLPGLWPLVALTRDGATEQAVRKARDMIEARPGLGTRGLADRLAVLFFVAEAEGVPVQALRNYIPKEKLMTSTLYQEILAEGVEQGVEQGVKQGVEQGATQAKKETLLQVLTYRLGEVEPTIRERIQALGSAETLTSWHQEALQAVNAKAARKLVEKIKKAPLP